MNTFNTGVYPQEWATKLQDRLDKPTCWKEVADVIYSNTQTFNVPYMSTTPAVQSGTRGTAYAFQDFALTNESFNVTTKKIIPMFVDRADLAQCSLVNQMELATLQGTLIDEELESAMLATHATWTNVGDAGSGAVGLGATALTVSAANIDDIIRGVKRLIVKANGRELAKRNGIFFVWRPEDFELIEQFVQANGFNTADAGLKDGIDSFGGYYYMGAYHYVSNSHVAGHVFAGVKKCLKIGILKETYGQIVVTQDPALQSGIGIVSRVDYGTKLPTTLVPVTFDINVT